MPSMVHPCRIRIPVVGFFCVNDSADSTLKLNKFLGDRVSSESQESQQQITNYCVFCAYFVEKLG